MEHFCDLVKIEEQDMPGRKRRLVIGKDMMMVYVEREAGTTQEHTHGNEQFVYLLKGKARLIVDGESHEAEAGQVAHNSRRGALRARSPYAHHLYRHLHPSQGRSDQGRSLGDQTQKA